MIIIPANEQEKVNQLRIELAQVGIDMACVNTFDGHSRAAKEKAIDGLRVVRNIMDNLGILHSAAMRRGNG